MTRRPAPTSQDLVFTLFGDYLLAEEAPIWVGSLIALLGPLGLSPMATRTVLSRMNRKGWLAVERRGPWSYYGLTRRGRKLLEEGRRRIYHPPRDERWDGAWYLITYSIPESRRRLRDQLRVQLMWLGCGMAGNGVWITPHDVRAEVNAVAAALHVTRHLQIFRAEHAGPTDVDGLVEQAWDLRALDARYASFLNRWRAGFEGCRRCLATGKRDDDCLSPASCFVRRFRLVHEYRAFPLLDPYLPRELLPSDWKGFEAARLFEHYHDLLAEPAVRYVEAVVRQGRAHTADAATPRAAVNQ